MAYQLPIEICQQQHHFIQHLTGSYKSASYQIKTLYPCGSLEGENFQPSFFNFHCMLVGGGKA